MSLGQRIARLRQDRNETLQDVANGAGLTPSFLSRLERDQVNISVNNLRKLAQFFGVPMTHFFEGEDQGPAVVLLRADERPRLDDLETDAEVYALTPPPANLDARLIVAGPGVSGSYEGAPMLFVIGGQLRCQVGEQEYSLGAGDTLVIQRAMALRWENVGDDRATALLVQAPGE